MFNIGFMLLFDIIYSYTYFMTFSQLTIGITSRCIYYFSLTNNCYDIFEVGKLRTSWVFT